MTYTKAVAIDQCYIRINGGVLSTENKVKREDIEPYLLSALAWAWGIETEERLQRALRAKRNGVADATSFDDLRITQFLTPQYDEQKKQYYVEIGNIASIGGMNYFEIAPMHGFEPIYKIEKRSELAGLGDIADSVNFAYTLRIKGYEERVYFSNLKNCGDCQLEVTTNADFSKIGNNDTLPIPNGKEVLVIERVVEFFTGQKIIPDDNRVDQQDAKVA